MRIPDYNNCLVNLSNSVLKHFGIEPFHETIKEVDKMLEGNDQVIVFLFDGMGSFLLEKHLDVDNYMRMNVRHKLSSVFPPTTVAATDAFLLAKYPVETGYLGWTQYFPHHGEPIEVFTNKGSITSNNYPQPKLRDKYLDEKNIVTLINEQSNDTKAYVLFSYPVDKKGPRLLSSFIKKAYKLAHSSPKTFVYAYWPYPDHTIHEKGVDANATRRQIQKINRLFVRYTTKPVNQSVLTFAIADHGLIDVKPIDILKEHPAWEDMMEKPWAIESRAASFFIKKEFEKQFKNEFNEAYGDKFELYTKEQVLKNNIFGLGKPHPMVEVTLGNFLAIAIDKYNIRRPDDHRPFIGHHAGATDEEYTISLVGVNGTLLEQDKERWRKEDEEKNLNEAKRKLNIDDDTNKVESLEDNSKQDEN